MEHKLFEIPDNPIDQYKLNWWHLSQTEHWCYISEMVAVYHVNTPWGRVGSPERRGADLLDVWQLLENGHFTGRIPSWEAIRTQSTNDNFTSKEETVKEAVERCKQFIEEKKESIGRIERMIATLTTSEEPK